MSGGVKWGGLDGLRALAVFAVVGAHFRFLNLGAAIGVDLFFVLSGFLITSLLLREHQRTAAVSLRRFWIRRGLRLLPALACGVLVALVVAQWAKPEQRHATWTGLPFVLFYFGNWARVAGGPFALGLLVHTWSPRNRGTVLLLVAVGYGLLARHQSTVLPQGRNDHGHRGGWRCALQPVRVSALG